MSRGEKPPLLDSDGKFLGASVRAGFLMSKRREALYLQNPSTFPSSADDLLVDCGQVVAPPWTSAGPCVRRRGTAFPCQGAFRAKRKMCFGRTGLGSTIKRKKIGVSEPEAEGGMVWAGTG